MSRLKSPFVAAIASAALTASVVGGVAIAQTATSPVITACVAENSGNVRIVKSTTDCKANETVTTWNQQGETGPQGIPGTAGADGVSGWTQVQSEGVSVAPYTYGRQEATCPQAGQKVLGGGYGGSASTSFGEGTTRSLTFFGSLPSDDGTKWVVHALNETGESLGFTAYAICGAVL